MSAEDRQDHWAHLEGAALSGAAAKLGDVGSHAAEVAARARFLAMLGLQAGERVLDVGAGTGVVSLDVARRGGRVVALDPSAGLLALADARVEAVVGDARALPFADASFDHAVCHWVLLHVGPAERVIEEMRRVVRPGGRVLCVECDWETAVVHPGERDVTRRIFHASIARWVDGWIGRRLAPLFARGGLRDVVVEPIVDVDRGEGPGLLRFLRERADIAVQAGAIGVEEGAAWWAAIERAVPLGQYFFAFTQFAVLGVRA